MPPPSPMSLHDRFDRIREVYAHDHEVLWLLALAEPRWMRVARRDDLVRGAIAEHFPGKLTCAAKALSTALTAYLLSNWPAEAALLALPGWSPRHVTLHQIMRANSGKPLGWRQITNICQIAKNPPRLQSARGKVAA
jgi:hypothetical protein